MYSCHHYPYFNSFQVPKHRCMIVKVLDLEKDKVRLIIKGEGHTFMNALVEELVKRHGCRCRQVYD